MKVSSTLTGYILCSPLLSWDIIYGPGFGETFE